MRWLWLLIVMLFPTALAAPKCSDVDVSITTVDGIGTVYSSSDASDETETRFFEACFERSGWLLRAPLLIVRETTAGTVVSAENANLEAQGASGTIQSLLARGETTTLAGIKLRLEPSYQINGFASARYDVTAQSGTLIGQQLTLENAVFYRLSDSGAVVERYQAKTALLEDNRVSLRQLSVGTPLVGFSAQLGSSNPNGFGLSGVSGSIGRNSAGSELGFSASAVLQMPNGIYRLENARFSVFGIPIYLGRLEYDPRCPFEFPVVFGLANGLTAGVENLRFTCDGKARGTFAVYNLFTRSGTPPFRSLATIGLAVGYTEGTSNYFIGQTNTNSFRASVQHEPSTGFTSAFGFDTGARIESPTTSLRSAEGRVGITKTFSALQALSIRPKLEFGTIGESLGTVTRDFHGFVRGNLGIGFSYSLAGLSFSGNWNGRWTHYFGDTWNSAYSDYIANLGIGYTLPNLGSLSLAYANTEQPLAPPFANHALTPSTTISATLRFAPSLNSLPLVFTGIALEQPSLGFFALYNLRSAVWVNQRLDLGGNISWYNGSTPTDLLGNRFQTPLLSFSPRASYDFIPQKGTAGLSFTYYGLSLAYTLGFDIGIPTGAFSLTFGLRLR